MGMSEIAVKRYEKYKDSGVEWIGEVPEGWEVKKIKYLVKQNKGAIKTGPFGSQLKSEDIVHEGVKIYNQRSVLDKDFENGYEYISDEKYKELEAFTIYEGDILVTSRGTIGKVVIVPFGVEKGVLHPCLLRMQIDKNLYTPELVERIFNDTTLIENQIKYSSNATTIDVIYSDTLKNIIISTPPLNKQQRIVSFIKDTTSEIDSLIADKEKLIELLQEKRQAIISEAVTKGLDKNVKMKDSGTPWIGEVPEGWEVKRIKHVAMLQSGEGITSEGITDYDEYPVYGGNGLRGYTETYTHDGKYILIGRQGALCGNINYASGRFWASEHAVVVKPLVRLETLWLGELLRSMNLNQYSVSAAQPGLAVEKIKNLFMPLPSFEEQQIIADFIGQKASEIDSLIQQTKTQIVSLIEYRQSLISEVVTGKIMV